MANRVYCTTKEELAANILPIDLYDTIQNLATKTKEGKQIFCFGTGKICDFFCEEAKKYEFKYSNLFFVDNNMSKVGSVIRVNENEIPILSKSQMLSRILTGDMIILMVGSKFCNQLYNELLKESLPNVEIFNIKVLNSYGNEKKKIVYNSVITEESQGYCPICETEVSYNQFGKIARYDLLCNKCASIPRQRAIIVALNKFIPNWREFVIHESSPGGVSSDYIKAKCEKYTSSQYFKDNQSGDIVMHNDKEILCQNIEKMSFEDEIFDVFMTQDVFEHVMNPQAAFKEISRVLKKDGVHIFTIPWYGEYEYSRCRAKIDEKGKVEYLEEPIYHGNPVDESGSLVVYDWGKNLVDIIYQASGMTTTVFLCESKKFGLVGDFLEVFISIKN